MFFISQNLKHILVTYSFLELLIFFLSILVQIFISYHILHIKAILYLNRNSKGNQIWNKNKSNVVLKLKPSILPCLVIAMTSSGSISWFHIRKYKNPSDFLALLEIQTNSDMRATTCCVTNVSTYYYPLSSSVTQKSIPPLPSCIQRFLLWLQRYDFEMH